MTIKNRILSFIDEKLMDLSDNNIYEEKDGEIWINNKYTWEDYIIDNFFKGVNECDIADYISSNENDWVSFKSKNELYSYVIDAMIYSFKDIMEIVKEQLDLN